MDAGGNGNAVDDSAFGQVVQGPAEVLGVDAVHRAAQARMAGKIHDQTIGADKQPAVELLTWLDLG